MFFLEIMKNFLLLRRMKHWNRLFREIVWCLPWEHLKSWSNKCARTGSGITVTWVKDGLHNFSSTHPVQFIYCRYSSLASTISWYNKEKGQSLQEYFFGRVRKIFKYQPWYTTALHDSQGKKNKKQNQNWKTLIGYAFWISLLLSTRWTYCLIISH